ncbi:hypothetical protein [Klebsiella pneumoniae]|uniref:hypothetical protein n=1 Tax=Klebsiella pneumoniae TaxID=573 RepID=UPI0022443D13|nr:hypothetical protein [Klebsiella pneumoniae]
MTHFFIFFDGSDYYATPHKSRAEEWPGGVLYEYEANPDDDQSLVAMADYVAAQTGVMLSLQFSW